MTGAGVEVYDDDKLARIGEAGVSIENLFKDRDYRVSTGLINLYSKPFKI